MAWYTLFAHVNLRKIIWFTSVDVHGFPCFYGDSAHVRTVYNRPYWPGNKASMYIVLTGTTEHLANQESRDQIPKEALKK